jgi:hypothetical protein
MMESTSSYRDLAEVLRERIAVIGDREWYQRDSAGQLERLKAVSERITAIGSTLPAPVDPQLAHFLQRCSYDKALAFLESM